MEGLSALRCRLSGESVTDVARVLEYAAAYHLYRDDLEKVRVSAAR